MKILYYSSHPHLNLSAPAGYATHMKGVMKAFEALGHELVPLIMGGEEVRIIEKNEKKRSIKNFVKRIVPKVLWESFKDYRLRKFDAYAAGELEKMVSIHKPDFIYERYNFLQDSGSLVAAKHHIPHLVEVNSPYSFERKRYQGNSFFLKKADSIEGEVMKWAHKVIVVSTALKTHFIEKHGVDASKFVVTPNAINLEEVKLSESWNKSLNIRSGTTVIGFSGSISEWHGVDILVDVQKSLKKLKLNTMMLVVGDGESLDVIKKKVSNCNLDDDFIFTGSVPYIEIFNYINLFDIAIMPRSNWYGSPVKIFEYGIMKKPVIAPDNVPMRDVITHQVHGLLTNMEVQNIVENITFLVQNKESGEKMANDFHQKVLHNHTWKHVAAEIIKHF